MAVKVYNHLSVDLVFDSTIPSIDVVQGDTARGLIVTYLTEIDGLDGSNVSAVIKVRRSDGEAGYAPARVESLGADMAQVIVDPSAEYTALIDCPGVAEALLEISSGGDVISTFRFRIDVKENPFYGTTIGSLTPQQLETVAETVAQYLADHPEVLIAIPNRSIHHKKIMSNDTDPGDGGGPGSGAITGYEIATRSIINRNLGANSVQADQIQAGAVNALKLANASVMENKVAVVGAEYVMANGNTYVNPGISASKLAPDIQNKLGSPVLIGSRAGTGENRSGTVYENLQNYRFLILCCIYQDRVMATTVIPTAWLSNNTNDTDSHQANYYQGASAFTAYLFLTKPASGSTNWKGQINASSSGVTVALYGVY